MSVYIKGFPLPNNCGACPLRLAWCRERIYMVTRPERCPLIEIPPHGRLIDVDVSCKECQRVAEEYDGIYPDCTYCPVHFAPTIIPASGGNENE